MMCALLPLLLRPVVGVAYVGWVPLFHVTAEEEEEEEEEEDDVRGGPALAPRILSYLTTFAISQLSSF